MKKSNQETSAIDKVSHMVHQLMEEHFFGELSITFQDGRPRVVKVNRTLKLDDL